MPLSRRGKPFPAAGHLCVLLKKSFVFIFISHSVFLLCAAFLCLAGDIEGKCASLPRGALHLYIAALLLRDLPGEVEANANALHPIGMGAR